MREERRLLTVLFADVVGSTELGSQTDPEVLRQQMTRYYERMKEVAETHGGTVEKFIGDAVMVVFGVPRIHDDDAERAVRCGLAMQEAMAALNRELDTQLAVRVGINSGEAVVQSGDDGQFIVGDAVNIAARLPENADAGEVIAGPLTEQLTRSAVEYERRAPVSAKGKTTPLRAFRAIRTTTAVPRQFRGVPGLHAPLIGRDRELQFMVNTFSRVVEDRQAHLVTLLGSAGIGKSRLIEEGLRRIGAAFSPRVRQGRCLPYGTGITYWPFIEILRDDAGISLEDDREMAIGKLHQRLASLPLRPDQVRAVERRLAVVLGVDAADVAIPEVPAARVNAELAWAIRRHIEAQAADNPVVVVVDDLQWAEPPILELIQHVTQRSTAVPVLWLCVARPEFLEAQPQWGAGRSNTSLITLNPLNAAETSTLISRLLEVEDIPPALHQQLLERSEGNPLFCEEFLRMLIDEGQLLHVEQHWRAGAGAKEIRVPESIQALLAARLDSLPDGQKQIIKAASIVGDAVNIAARLQHNADAGEVIAGPLTEQLTRSAVEYERRAPVSAKGKTTPLRAFRAIRTTTAVPRQFRGVPGLHAPLIGRDRELQFMINTFSRVVEDRQAHLFTLLGSAGIGKSRLVEEGLRRLGAAFSPRVRQGRCLPYGTGITYWPFIEILRDDAGISLEDDREMAIGKLHQRLASLLLPPDQVRAVERRLAVVLGVEAADVAIPEVPAARVNAELAWAIRRHIEALAADNPVVVVLDDLQWAEPAILELIEHVTRRSTSVPVLWLCVARPEFLEMHPQWGAGRSNTSLITLNPLNKEETSTLISRRSRTFPQSFTSGCWNGRKAILFFARNSSEC